MTRSTSNPPRRHRAAFRVSAVLASVLAVGAIGCEPDDPAAQSQGSTERTAPPPETGTDKTPSEPGRPVRTPPPPDVRSDRADSQPETITAEVDWPVDDLVEKASGLAEELGLTISDPVPVGRGRLYVVSAGERTRDSVDLAPEFLLRAQCFLYVERPRDGRTQVVLQNPVPVLRNLSPKGGMATNAFEKFVLEMQSSFE